MTDVLVVGCSECDQLWLLDEDDRRDQETVQCPLCFHQHQADHLRALERHENRDVAAELRSRRLAKCSGELEEYAEELDYGEAEDEVQRRIDDAAPMPADEMDLHIQGADRFEDLVDYSIDRHREFFEKSAADAFSEFDNRFDGLVDDRRRAEDLPLADTLEGHIEEWQADCEREIIEERTGEFALDDQYPADTVAAICLDDDSVVTRSGDYPGVWASLMEQSEVQDLLVDGIRRFARARSDGPTELSRCLEARGVPEDLRPAIMATARAESEDALRRAIHGHKGKHGLLYLVRRLGTQRASLEKIYSVARFVGWADQTFDIEPATIAVRLEDGFREQAKEQRDAVVTLLSELARNVHVTAVASPVDLPWLKVTHSEQAEFSERWSGRDSSTRVDEIVERGVDALGDRERGLNILRAIYESPNKRVSYNELTSTLGVSTSAISQWMNTYSYSLSDLGLVDLLTISGRSYVELTAAGQETIETIDSETTRQQRLGDIFSSLSHQPDHGREDPRERVRTAGGDPRRKGDGLAPVGELSRPHAYGVAAAAEPQGFSLVDYPHEEVPDYRCADLWTDQHAGRAIVSTEYVGPLQYWVSTARALTAHQVFDFQLTPERLESEDHDFWDLFTEHRQILRSSRCLGHLPDEIDTAEEFIEGLQDARDKLGDLTRKLCLGQFEDEKRFRSEITRDAIGLCGTMIHLLDLCDVDVVREVRVPNFSRDFDEDRMDALCESLSVGAAIQSRYGQFTAYRQLFEDRPEKLDWSIDVDVDAESPDGELIGSYVVAGNFGNTEGSKTEGFVDDLRNALSNPASKRDDAPEFEVPIPVRAFEFDREHFSKAVYEMCRSKNLNPSREAVSTIRLFVDTPYDAAEALYRLQHEETRNRDLRIGEIREALAGIDADRLLPQGTPAGRKIVAALLAAEKPLSTSSLEDAAGVSRTSITGSASEPRAGDKLRSLGLLERSDDGWRLTLPFNDDEERYDDHRVPWIVAEAETLQVRDVLCDLVFDVLPPGHPAQKCWSRLRDDGLPDLSDLPEHAPWIKDWVPVLEDVLDKTSVLSLDAPGPVEEARFGTQPSQQSIQTSITEAVADD